VTITKTLIKEGNNMKDQCQDCGAKKGSYHKANCDREVCSQCSKRYITCNCKSSNTKVPFGFEPVNPTHLWEEFLCDWYRADVKINIKMCGLCGGGGRVNIESRTAPDGSKFAGPKSKNCICPNGRANKRNDEAKDISSRGLGYLKFNDRYDQVCTLQNSSLATEPAIRLGVTNSGPQIPGPTGNVNEDIKLMKMHLTQKMVTNVLPYLTKFARTGDYIANMKSGFKNKKIKKTMNRFIGLASVEFSDHDFRICTIQDSSLATEAAIWFGVSNSGPQISGPSGKMSEDVNQRMHLTQEQVEDLLPFLNEFSNTGRLDFLSKTAEE
jgi:hypothetical protein